MAQTASMTNNASGDCHVTSDDNDVQNECQKEGKRGTEMSNCVTDDHGGSDKEVEMKMNDCSNENVNGNEDTMSETEDRTNSGNDGVKDESESEKDGHERVKEREKKRKSESESDKVVANHSQSSLSNSNNIPGPDDVRLKAILERTGYTLDVTGGQRKYGGPPPDWSGPPPAPGCEIFVGKIPKEVFEDELIPLFEKIGTIWDLRLMMDPVNGNSRGYAFVTFMNKDDAQNAVQELDGFEVRKGKFLKVNVSVPNLRLFVGNIPKSKSKEEILQEFSKLAAGLVDVIVYSSPDDRKRNRGFCFLEYDSHKSASSAKRKLSTSRTKVWGCDILVDWADPQEEPDEETMSKVKVLYVRNLTSEVTEQQIKTLFQEIGVVERVKKIKDYAFVHFEDREKAIKAMRDLNGSDLAGARMEVSLAKPPSDRKKKEEILRNRERRVMMMMQQRAMMVNVGGVGCVAGRGLVPLMQSMQSQAFSLPLPPPCPPLLAPQQRSQRQRNGRSVRNSVHTSVPSMTNAMPNASAYRPVNARNYGRNYGGSAACFYSFPNTSNYMFSL